VLPTAILYDLLLCPFVLWLTSAALRGPAPERAPRPDFSHVPRLAPAFRLATAGAVPGLRLAGSSGSQAPPPARAEPKLRLAGGRSPSLAASAPAPPAGRAVKVNFAGSGRGNSLGGASALRTPQTPPGKSPGKGWLRPAKPARQTWYSKSPSSRWLRRNRSSRPGRGRRLLQLVGGRR